MQTYMHLRMAGAIQSSTSTSGHRRWYTEGHTPTVILKSRVPRIWPYSSPLWRYALRHRIVWCTHKQNLDQGLSKRDVEILIMNSLHVKRIISPVFPFLSLLCSSSQPHPFLLFPLLSKISPYTSFSLPFCLLFLHFSLTVSSFLSIFLLFLHLSILPFSDPFFLVFLSHFAFVLSLSSCYRFPCRKPRRVCPTGFYYSEQVCQCIPNYMRPEWN